MTTKQKQINVVWLLACKDTCEFLDEVSKSKTQAKEYKNQFDDPRVTEGFESTKFIRASSKKEVLKAARKLGLLTWAYCDDLRASKHECNLNRDLDGVCFVCGKRKKQKEKVRKVNENNKFARIQASL